MIQTYAMLRQIRNIKILSVSIKYMRKYYLIELILDWNRMNVSQIVFQLTRVKNHPDFLNANKAFKEQYTYNNLKTIVLKIGKDGNT